MTAPTAAPTVSVTVDGTVVELDATSTLLDALRDGLGITSVKDGCSPQGQCGCCTVLVDGVARVACVTPVRRVAGRAITTPDGLERTLLDRLVQSFEAAGASQCGFCTPGILVRLVALARHGVPTEDAVRTALSAHLCRCTGFQPIVEAACIALDPALDLPPARDAALAQARASIESDTPQAVGAEVVRGETRFVAESAPPGSVVAYGTPDGGYVTARSVSLARTISDRRQGRNSTISLRRVVPTPMIDGAVLAVHTGFIEPAYVEPDASWSLPGGDPSPAAANGGDFGAKTRSRVLDDARRLADDLGEPVLALWPRDEVARRGAKRPPVAVALRADGSGAVTIAATPDSEPVDPLVEMLRTLAPTIDVAVVAINGPRISTTPRGAVLAEVLAVRAAIGAVPGDPLTVTDPTGARATVSIDEEGTVHVAVAAGEPLCRTTLRSYVIGAVHQGLGMVRSEGVAVDEEGIVHDLTIRSYGIISARAMPPVRVVIEDDDRPALPAGVSVMAATMAAAWVDAGCPPDWPTSREVA